MVSDKQHAAIGLICLGVLAIPVASRDLADSLVRHWEMADTMGAYAGTLQTYASEIFLEIDFIGPIDTLIAWLGVLYLVIGLLILALGPALGRGVQSLDTPATSDSGDTDEYV